MVFRQGILAGIFSGESGGTDRTIAPDVAARMRAEADSRPVNVFDPADNSERAQRARLNLAGQGGSFMGFGLADDQKKKEKEDKRLMNEWLTRVVLGRMTPAQWDAQMINFGGRQMSNADAQKIRKWGLANIDDVFSKGKEAGKFKEEDRDHVKWLAKESFELNQILRDKGTFTPEQQERWDKLQQDPLKREYEEVIADTLAEFEQKKALGQEMAGKVETATTPRAAKTKFDSLDM